MYSKEENREWYQGNRQRFISNDTYRTEGERSCASSSRLPFEKVHIWRWKAGVQLLEGWKWPDVRRTLGGP